MFRTACVDLKIFKGIAYKQKIRKSGNAGLTILTERGNASFTINRRGGFKPYNSFDMAIFDNCKDTMNEALNEAFELTQGLTYSMKGSVTYQPKAEAAEERCGADATAETTEEDICVAESEEYRNLIEKYTDKKDRFNFDLMNKDMIQFSSRSTKVGKMIEEKVDVGIIVSHVVKAVLENLTRRAASDEFIANLITTLDNMETRSAFKELRKWLKLQMRKR